MVDVHSAGRVWLRNLWVFRDRWYYGLLPNFFEPVFYLLGMGVGLGYYVSTGGAFAGDYLGFIAPGLVAAAAMNGASFETTYNVFVKLHFGRIYDATIATPVSIEDVTVGEAAWATTRALLYGGVFLLVTLFFGTEVSWRLLPALAALALVGFAFAALGLAFTAVVPTIELFSYYFTLFLTPSFLFSDIFFPVAERFPPFFATLAAFTPLYRSVQLVRGLVRGEYATVPWDVAYLLAFGTVLLAFAVWRMRKRMIT
ncbi:MAG: ABC transporter permease, partial [Trueperaceae bacterium]|nr:ABC transporter permease [Trueperaceae bacterium]